MDVCSHRPLKTCTVPQFTQLPPGPSPRQSAFCVCGSACSAHFTQMRPHETRPTVSGSLPSAPRVRGSSRLWQDRCPLPLTAEGYSRAWTATLTHEGRAPSPLLTALGSGDSAQAPRPPGGRWSQCSSQRSWEDTREAHSIQTKQLPKTPTNMHPRSTLPPACGEVAVTAVVPETMILGVCPQGGSGSPLARGPASPCDPEQRGHLHLGTVGERTSFPQEVGATDLGRDPPAARWHVCPRWRRRWCGSRGQLPRPSCRACQALPAVAWGSLPQAGFRGQGWPPDTCGRHSRASGYSCPQRQGLAIHQVCGNFLCLPFSQAGLPQ